MNWIFLSPHYDDIALSCGGLVWELSHAGQRAEIWTICGGAAPDGPISPFAQSLHARWDADEQAVSRRQAEDHASCAALGAKWQHRDIPDCIYRPGGPTGQFYYASEESLFGELHPAEETLVTWLALELCNSFPNEARVIAPLSLGGHVDHRLTRRAAEQSGAPLLYFADYPYVLKHAAELAELQKNGWQSQFFSVSARGVSAWQNSVAAHASQISSFWPNLPAMREAVSALWSTMGQGVMLWQRPEAVE